MTHLNRLGFLAAVGSLLLMACSASQTGNAPGAGRGSGTNTALPASVRLSAEEARVLLFMREEEKLARDVYLALADYWRAQADGSALVLVLGNISASEQQHMDRLKALVGAAGLADPVDAAETRGRFADAALAQLYTELVARGTTSLGEAYKVGALIEEKDIADLAAAIRTSPQATVDTVYGNLQCGSGNHLRAFAAPFGTSYVAQVLSQAEVNAILADGGTPCGRG